jgi:hypothetical protein
MFTKILKAIFSIVAWIAQRYIPQRFGGGEELSVAGGTTAVIAILATLFVALDRPPRPLDFISKHPRAWMGALVVVVTCTVFYTVVYLQEGVPSVAVWYAAVACYAVLTAAVAFLVTYVGCMVIDRAFDRGGPRQ